MRSNLLTFFFLIISLPVIGQFAEYQGDLEGYGRLFSDNTSPFWLHTNTLGRIDEKTHFAALFSPKMTIEDRDYNIEIGGGVLIKDGFEDGVALDQAYFSYLGRKVGVVLGKKHRADLYKGLGASNENILWSLNAGAVPGARFFIHEPLFLLGNHGIGVKGSYEEYITDDDRYIDQVRIHHKSFNIVYRSRASFEISLGVQHFVQWGGINDDGIDLPSDFKDYIKVITGRASDEVGDQEVNALGNQIGSYEINVKSKINDLDVEFIYNHIFEDASGMKMGNFPDGRYGLYVEDNRDSFWGTPWLTAFMYELYYTKNQSRGRVSSLVDGADNYFNNNLYRSGWTYNNRVIGVPFILLNDNRFRIGTNILTVHHVGLRGQLFEELPYRFLLSYRKNYGVKDSFFEETREVFSTLLEVELINSDYQLKALLGADIKSHDNSNFGIGVNFSKTIF